MKTSINWILIGIIFLGAALRFYGLGEQCYFHDEIFELYVAQRSIPYIFKAIGAAPVHSPLNQLISHCFLHLGHNEFVLRLPAAIWGVLGVWVVYLAGACFFNRRVGLFSAFLLAISSYHIRYSQEGRMYALLVLAGLLSQYFFWRGLQGDDRRSWIGYVLATSLALYTHLFAVFILASQVLFVCLRYLLLRRSRPEKAGARFFWISLLAIVVLFLPRLIPVAGNTFSRESFVAMNVGAPPVARGLASRGVELTDFTTILILFGGGAGFAFYLYFVFFVIGVEGSLKRYGPATAYLVLTAALPFLSFFVLKPSRIFGARYLLFLLPVYYLLAAAGADRLREVRDALWKRRRPGKSLRARAYYLFLVLVFLAASVRPLKMYYRDWSYPIGDRLKFDWRKLNSFLEKHAQPGDVIIPSGGIWYYHLVYLREYLSPRLQEKLTVDNPEKLAQAGIWWVGGDPNQRDYPPGIKPVEFDPGIPGLPVSCGRGPASFTEETFPGLVKIHDLDAIGITGKVSVRPGRIFWLSIRLRGVERHYERYSPYPGIYFYAPPGEKVADSYPGVRLVTNRGDGWTQVVLNGITPSNAASAQIILRKDDLHIGDGIEVSELRFFGDWGEPGKAVISDP
ncbi:MAG: glycosyltransferase family 39 protein [PVC group bacterium]